MAHYKLYSHVDKYNHCVTAMHGLKHPVNVIQASQSEVHTSKALQIPGHIYFLKLES